MPIGLISMHQLYKELVLQSLLEINPAVMANSAGFGGDVSHWAAAPKFIFIIIFLANTFVRTMISRQIFMYLCNGTVSLYD